MEVHHENGAKMYGFTFHIQLEIWHQTNIEIMQYTKMQQLETENE